MSSDLKDARWGLAMWYAASDGMDWYAMDYTVKEGYLRVAQERLEEEPDDIPYWADVFRNEE